MRTPETQTVHHEAPITPAINLLVRSSFLTIMFSILFHAALCQERSITGRVTNEKGENLPGVNVVIKGTTVGTVTDSEGHYFINIPDNETILIFSFVGYTTIEALAGPRTTLAVEMTPDVTSLNEVVVTGYSSIEKKDLSSSIAVVDVEDMKKIASPNFAEQLQGKVAGVQISTSGDPGSFQYVRIRGIGTINNNEPLYVIDGVPIQNETDMNFLNPNDIETLQVLKDAAAASIYGARAANGVVVITTKQGKERTKFNFDFFTGIQIPQEFPELANPAEMLEIQKGLYAGAGRMFQSIFYIPDADNPGSWILPDYLVNHEGYHENDPDIDPSEYVLNTEDPELFKNNFPIAAANKDGTNWFEELFRPSTMTNMQLSSSSGNEKASHYFSINYYDYNGILINNKWRRVQARINNTFHAGRNFRLGENLNLAFQKNKGKDVRNGPFSSVGDAYSYLTIAPVHDIEGYWAATSLSPIISQNPVAFQTRYADNFDNHTVRITGSVFAELDFLEQFTAKVNAGLDYLENPWETYGYYCPECGGQNQNNFLEKGWYNKRSWISNATLKFNRSLGKHNIYALAGVEARETYFETFKARGNGLTYGDDPYYRELTNVQSGTTSISSATSINRMVSAFINSNYTFNEKYIVAATLRADGTSKFINNKYGVFPSLSAAWRVTQERFASNQNFLTELKLRTSYGLTGNNEVVGGDYPGYSTYGASLALSSYPIDGSLNRLTQGFAQIASGNQDLKWETSTVLNLGFDATLFGKLDVTAEWYNRKTNDMIFAVEPPLESGIPFAINQNIGAMLNQGLELEISYHSRSQSQQLSYALGFTGSHFTNEVLSLADSLSFRPGASTHGGYQAITRTQAGYPVSQFYGYVTDGLWQSQEEINEILSGDTTKNKSGAKPGRMKFKDINGDGKIDEKDRTFIGSPIPKFVMGLNMTLTYKNFDLTAFFSGVFGVKIFNVIKAGTDFNTTDVLLAENRNRSKAMLYDAGKRLPALDLTDSYSGKISDYFVEEGSFFRFRNLIIGYTIPRGSDSLVRKVRFYFQAQNLFTLTEYSGLDPDVTVFNMERGDAAFRDGTTGVDVGRYPWSRQYLIGLNFEF
jgi:TonB-dependent starch-binding outer membrane protein SusC